MHKMNNYHKDEGHLHIHFAQNDYLKMNMVNLHLMHKIPHEFEYQFNNPVASLQKLYSIPVVLLTHPELWLSPVFKNPQI